MQLQSTASCMDILSTSITALWLALDTRWEVLQRKYLGFLFSSRTISMTFRVFLQQLLTSEPQSLSSLSFVSCILIEPMLSPGGAHHLAELRKHLVKVAYERRDVWTSPKAAMSALSETKAWHPAVTKLYVVSIPGTLSKTSPQHSRSIIEIRIENTSCGSLYLGAL